MLTVTGVVKTYGALRALDGVSIEFRAGEIHAVLGENGAGKSTLMHVLSGFALPDSGTVELDGQPLPTGHPFACRQRGIAMIHQHFTLVPAFSVRENLALAQLPSMGSLKMDRIIEPAQALASDLGWTIDLDAKVEDLSVGAEQRVEILKSLAGEAKVVIFDEPTAVLSADEIEDLFRVLRKLKEAGKTVILIAHKLAEVMRIADFVTVLRRGKVVGAVPIADASPALLAEWMVGELPEPLHASPRENLKAVLSVENVHLTGSRGEPALRGISFEVARGEIVGFGGVDGNGQHELAELLVGIRSPQAGSMTWREADPYLVSYIPEDRQTEGLALSMSVEENLLISGHRRADLTNGPFLRKQSIREWSQGLIGRFSVKAESPTQSASSLSGGNQQKVVVARALDQTPDLLVAVNPTRGLDVRAAAFVHSQILAARDSGAAVVLISTDLDELQALASRILFLSRGQIVRTVGAAALVGGLD